MVIFRTFGNIRRTTLPPRWIMPRIGCFSFSSVPRPRAPLSRFRCPSGLFLNRGGIALVASHDIDSVDLDLAVEDDLGEFRDQSLTQVAVHRLNVVLIQSQLFPGDLPVRRVQAHEIQANATPGAAGDGRLEPFRLDRRSVPGSRGTGSVAGLAGYRRVRCARLQGSRIWDIELLQASDAGAPSRNTSRHRSKATG